MTTRKEILNLPCSVCGAKGAQKACLPCHKSYHDSCVHECGAPSPVPPPPAETGPSPTPLIGPAMNARILRRNPCTKCKKDGAQLACEPCQVSFHVGCGHECPQNEPPPAENDSEAAQPALLGPATPPLMIHTVLVGTLLPVLGGVVAQTLLAVVVICGGIASSPMRRHNTICKVNRTARGYLKNLRNPKPPRF